MPKQTIGETLVLLRKKHDKPKKHGISKKIINSDVWKSYAHVLVLIFYCQTVSFVLKLS